MGVRLDSRDFVAALRKAEPELSRALVGAFERTGDIIVNIAKTKTNEAIRGPHTGRLVQSIRHGETTGSLSSGVSIDLLAGGTQGVDYAASFYLGAKPHVIEARQKKGALRFKFGGVFIFRRRVHHPGNAPHPVMKEAIESSLDGLERRVYAAFRAVLRRYGVEVA